VAIVLDTANLEKKIVGVIFINILLLAFERADPKSAKKDSQVVSLFYFFGICSYNVDEIDTRLILFSKYFIKSLTKKDQNQQLFFGVEET